jgi:uncharacterized protein YjgD (DUF1641 family)
LKNKIKQVIETIKKKRRKKILEEIVKEKKNVEKKFKKIAL